MSKPALTSAIFKKYLQCILAVRILTVDFVVCTLAVEEKKIRAGFDMSDWTIPLSDVYSCTSLIIIKILYTRMH
jgi:hypothetical protein